MDRIRSVWIALPVIVIALIRCDAPKDTVANIQPDRDCPHRLGDLSIALPCAWQVESRSNSMHWLKHGGNTVLLQHGDIARRPGPFDLDSSLVASFRERRVPGEMFDAGGTRFIHGIKTLSTAGDSLYIYMEDTVTWRYYHFDGHFRDPVLREGFLRSMKAAELVR